MQKGGVILIGLHYNGTRKCKSLTPHLCLVCTKCPPRLEGLFPLRFLPRVVNAPTIAGHLMREWHQIPRGTMVCVAMGDLQCAVYAANPNTSDAGLS